MRIVLIIMANVMVVVASIMGVNEYFSLKRHASFTLPFTDKMIALGIIDPSRRNSIIRQDKITHVIGILLSIIVWLMLARFIAGISAIPVFIVAAGYQLIALKPEMNECTTTRSQYFNSHKNEMDALKYHAYLAEVEGAPEEKA